MRIKDLNNRAFTLLEILLAAIIFVISVGGIFATLNAVRQPVTDKEKALTAAILEKQFLENLRTQVDERSYVTGPLALPPHTPAVIKDNFPNLDWSTINNGGYVLTYTVSCADGNGNCDTTGVARLVTVSATW